MYASEITLPGVSNTIIYTSLKDMETTISKFDLFISVDNFVPHLAYTIKKRGIVLWGKSDPTIFGYSENVNLLKDKKYLRARQFDIWESEKYDQSVFILPQKVMEEVKKWKV
jgi:ADP-heptose:LPS heptosyltransferase